MEYFNAHCHLELGWLRGRIPPGLPFCEWLSRIVAEKRAVDPAESAASAREGIAELRRTGTAALADILSLDTSAGALAAAGGMARVAFVELIEFSAAGAGAALERGLARAGALEEGGKGPATGLSPTAPYTTTRELMAGAVREAAARGRWLCIHAAETREETELLEHGRGPMRELLERPIAESGWTPPMMRPVPWLDACGALGPRTLLVHLNDVTEGEIALVASRGASAVVCPGTHAYFGRGEFPLRRLLEGGVRTYLGTDSLASNDALDMEREVRLACEFSPGLDPDRVRGLADAGRVRDFLT